MQMIVHPLVEDNIDNVIASLEQVPDALFNWFKTNGLKSNDLLSVLFRSY